MPRTTTTLLTTKSALLAFARNLEFVASKLQAFEIYTSGVSKFVIQIIFAIKLADPYAE